MGKFFSEDAFKIGNQVTSQVIKSLANANAYEAKAMEALSTTGNANMLKIVNAARDHKRLVGKRLVNNTKATPIDVEFFKRFF